MPPHRGGPAILKCECGLLDYKKKKKKKKTDRCLPDRSLIQQLSKQLPFHYDDIVTAIRMNKERTTFRQALKMLIEQEKTLGNRKQSKALVAKSAKALVGTIGSGNHRKP